MHSARIRTWLYSKCQIDLLIGFGLELSNDRVYMQNAREAVSYIERTQGHRRA